MNDTFKPFSVFRKSEFVMIFSKRFLMFSFGCVFLACQNSTAFADTVKNSQDIQISRLNSSLIDMTAKCREENPYETNREVKIRMSGIILRNEDKIIRTELHKFHDSEQPAIFEAKRKSLLKLPSDSPEVVYQSISILLLPYVLPDGRNADRDKRLNIMRAKISIINERSIDPKCIYIPPAVNALAEYIK